MYGKMFMFGDDMLMLHGAIFPALYECEHTARRRPDRCAQLDHGMYSHPLGDSAQLGDAK